MTRRKTLKHPITVTGYGGSRSEEEGLKSWVAASPALNKAGAETVEVVSHGHKGGTVRTEPFHVSVRVRDNQGKLITTENPHTGRVTKTWHAYTGKST